MKLLFVGDVVGQAGRQILEQKLSSLIDRHFVDLVVVNAENAAAGYGLTLSVMGELYKAGAHVLTSGNHIWDKKEILDVLDRDKRLLRPHNYPEGLPGRGYGIYETAAGLKVAVVNLEGRVFMKNLDCPFKTADRILTDLSGKADMILVDFHAEATSEKQALGHYLDGRVSAVVGTHTHVQTADEKILIGGTGYLTDAGMTGAQDAIIGNQKEPALQRFLTQLPVRLEVAKKDPLLCAVLITINEETGHCEAIERIQERP
ncbi:TIGR00282 family metallophosphoesterase [Geopsychrobacter electrodiphilus]|uniref:TIGR00282 family metallophosphoesterase n=1 Tax=Geopsychrobacter electrodiphilus TaxID=225196 RepID=UPI00035C8AE8|nr:TIGR00282 family metallophosphoesterase [Geopsychrobacter electrodiphilus]